MHNIKSYENVYQTFVYGKNSFSFVILLLVLMLELTYPLILVQSYPHAIGTSSSVM
jgi:hypothetical protein